MDITQATALAAAIVGLITPIIIQVTKQHIADGWITVYALGVSIILGVVAVGATNGFAHQSWGVVLMAIVGVAQAVYALIAKIVDGVRKTPDESLTFYAES